MQSPGLTLRACPVNPLSDLQGEQHKKRIRNYVPNKYNNEIMDWIITTLNWYVPLFALGIIVFPLTRTFFHQFFDRGYPFAKTIAILALSYIVFILGIYKLLPFTQTSLILIIAVFVIGYIYIKRTRLPRFALNKVFFIFLFEELLLSYPFFSCLYQGSGALYPWSGKIHGLRVYEVYPSVAIFSPFGYVVFGKQSD